MKFHFYSINMKYAQHLQVVFLGFVFVVNVNAGPTPQSPGKAVAGTYGNSWYHSYPRYSSSSYGTSGTSQVSAPCMGGLLQGLLQGGTQSVNLGSGTPLISGFFGRGGSQTGSTGIQYVPGSLSSGQNIFGSGGSSILSGLFSGLLGSSKTQTISNSLGGSGIPVGSGFSGLFGGSPTITSRISGQPASSGGNTFVLNQGSSVQNPLQSLLGGTSLSSILQSPNFSLSGSSAQNTAISNFIRMISRVPAGAVAVPPVTITTPRTTTRRTTTTTTTTTTMAPANYDAYYG